ncbi:TrlF family AAA-like ATPase [Undibacterium sp. SXout11W]|uniref:TrlF family AAA-like ATPase n=1 Tax=Undibacterium sp. SXout11W TaxID=3413050 RepID=UPI003BF14F35
MEHQQRIFEQPIGATFFRADLHLHCYGVSHDVSDTTMTPEAVIATAVRENLAIIAIADHNEIGSVERAIAAAIDQPVIVIPAVELSTPQGHLLCYFETSAALKRFHGRLTVMDSGLPNSRVQQAMIECLNLAQEQGGFCILAHVDGPSGFETEVPGASPHKADVLSHPTLLGIELKSAASDISYSLTDPNQNRSQLGERRIKTLQLGSRQYLARVLNSDAHKLEALGRNAEQSRKLTRYKMDTPSFQALRVALQDADSRVRIEDLVPTSIPHVVGLYAEGGFLAGQTIQFSLNLNCIVGGRGTGKSTTFEAVRCLVGYTDTASKVVDSEVWPDAIYLIWRDKSGQLHNLARHKDGGIENLDDPNMGPCAFEIDCFGQGEAQRISQQAQSNPLALLEYLDRFIDISVARADEEAARQQLLDLQTEIEGAEQKVEQIPGAERVLAVTKQQLQALQKPDVKELIELQRKLAQEKQVRTQITTLLTQAKRGSSTTLSSHENISEIRELADPANLSVGSAEFKAISSGAAVLEATLTNAETNIKAGIVAFEQVVTAQLAQWRAKESDAQKKIDDKRRELEGLKIQFDMSYIQKLTQDEALQQQNVKNLKTWIPKLQELRTQRNKVLQERWKTRNKVAMQRDAFGRHASQTLRQALSDLNVSLKYESSAYSQEASEQIIQAMGWRTNQQPRAAYLVENLTVPALLEAINKNDINPITTLKTREGIEIFNAIEAQEIIKRLGAQPVKYMLERVALHDRPRLLVTKRVINSDGTERHVSRDFAKLSLGQQQSVLLALMLAADSDRPLIVDQPEDNLDGEFIYATLVPVLRQAKERRQVIIVTHNANVAVLGDAEQIVVMKANNDRGEIFARGSIDHSATRESACGILEGAREAFLQRAKMYGLCLH